MNRYLLLVSILGLAISGFSQNASSDSCTCVPVAIEQARDSAQLIFFGEVIASETNWMSGGMKYTFRVNGSWKQPTPEIFYIKSGWDDKCGAFFKDGERYLIFANKNFTAWRTTRCLPNQAWPVETGILESFGTSFTPTADTIDTSKFAWTIGILGAVSIAFFFLLLGRAWMRRTR